MDEEVTLGADHLVQGGKFTLLLIKRISPVGTLDIGGGYCQWEGRVHHRQHSLPAPPEVECHWAAQQKVEEGRGGGRSEPDVELTRG